MYVAPYLETNKQEQDDKAGVEPIGDCERNAEVYMAT